MSEVDPAIGSREMLGAAVELLESKGVVKRDGGHIKLTKFGVSVISRLTSLIS